MLRDAIDQNKANVLFGSVGLYFYMGKTGIMAPAFVDQRHFDLSFALAAELRGRNPFPVEKQPASCGKADHAILPQLIELLEHLVVIVSPAHDEGSFSGQGRAVFHGSKGDVVDRGKILFSGRMNPEEDADRKVVFGQRTGFRGMISFS